MQYSLTKLFARNCYTFFYHLLRVRINLTNKMLHRVSEGDYQKDKYHRFIGAVQSNLNPGNILRGSGVMISPNLVLTAAHNIFDYRWQNVAKKVLFYPGLNGEVNLVCQSEKFKIHQLYATNPDKIRYDFGLIKLQRRLPAFTKQSQIVLGINFSHKEAILSVFGYPSKSCTFDKDGQIREGYQEGIEKQGITKIDHRKIIHKIQTASGQGGCPIIIGSQKNIIVGIHKGHGKDKFEIAVKLTLDIVLQLQAWRQELKGDKFKVIDMKTGNQIDLSSLLNENRKQSVKIPQHIQQITTHNDELKEGEMFEDLQKLIMENKKLFFEIQQMQLKIQEQLQKNEQLNRQLQFEKERNVKKDQMIESLKKQLKQAQTIRKAQESIKEADLFFQKVSLRQQAEKIKKTEEEIIERIHVQSKAQAKAIIEELKAKHEQQELKLRQKLMEYEYWIVEADRLHYSVSQAIANSPVKEKFLEFRRVAERANSTLEEEMGLWEYSNEQNRGGSIIQSVVNVPNPNDSDKHLRHQKRIIFEARVQILEQIIEEFIPIF